jgi:hypothetical protein
MNLRTGSIHNNLDLKGGIDYGKGKGIDAGMDGCIQGSDYSGP